jgi:uncharacterized protein YbjT (DUF2867 family)
MLGTRVVRLLAGRGIAVRILTRDPARARHLAGDHVEIVAGDVHDRVAVTQAMAGTQTVISAIQGFSGTGGNNPQSVDWQGNRDLIAAAKAGSVEHFVLVSVQGAAPDHPMELFRMKDRAEHALRASGLAWTIIRPTASMETWAKIVGEPLIERGATQLFGHGANPINFVSAADVAQFVALSVTDPAMRDVAVDVGGPENLSMAQFAQSFEAVTGKAGQIRHVPLPMMRAMAVLLRPLKPTIARQIQAGVVMDTRDMTFDASETARRYPAVAQTSLAEMVRCDYGTALRVSHPFPGGEGAGG